MERETIRVGDKMRFMCREKRKAYSNLERRKWTDEEEKLLMKYYGSKEGIEFLTVTLNRSRDAIRSRALMLGLKGEGKNWSEADDEVLIKYYEDKGLEVKRLLSKCRTDSAIKIRARRLGLKYTGEWSDNEIKLLINEYPRIGANVVKKLPNKNIRHIREKLKALEMI